MTRRASFPAKSNALFGIGAKSIDDAPEDEGDEGDGAEGVCVCWIDISFEFVVRAVGEKKKKDSGTQKLAVKALQGACQ